MSVQALGWVLDHSTAKGTDRLVLISIANHAGQNPDDGAWEAWPGIALIQREARLDRSRTVQDALARLVDAGALQRIVNGAPDERIRKDRRPNMYRILLSHGVPCGDTRCSWCGMSPRAERGDAATRHGVTRDDVTGCREASPEPSDNPSGQPVMQPSPDGDTHSDTDDGFDWFWSVYPLRVAKGAARRAWPAAVRAAGGVDVVVAGAERYRDDPGREDRYTRHPATWLRGECWSDPPLPPRPGSRGGVDRGVDVDRDAPAGVLVL